MIDASPLFSPIDIGTARLENRFVLPGMQRSLSAGGMPTQEVAARYRRFATGGCQLIITEATAIDHPSASRQPRCLRINADTRENWRHCANAVATAGGHLFIQLWHEGAHRPEHDQDVHQDGPTFSPSGLFAPGRGHGRPATVAEIHEIRDAFVRSAMIAREIGASGVEVHAAHGYLLDQFLWSQTNIRDDEYGGPQLLNRMRLPLEIVRDIKRNVGSDFPVSLRFSQFKEADYSARTFETPQELQLFCEAFEEAGVDAFHVSTRRFHEPAWPDNPLSLAGWVKQFATVPVIAVGSVGVDREFMATFAQQDEAKFNIPAGLQELLKRFHNNEFDLIAIGRGQLGDPDWVNKVREGRLDEIRPFTRQDIIGNIVWETNP